MMILISDLELTGFGNVVGNTFFGCVVYADDLLLISASVGLSGLQSMLNICYGFDRRHFMIFEKITVLIF